MFIRNQNFNKLRIVSFIPDIKKRFALSLSLILCLILCPKNVHSKPECRLLAEQPIKFEAWLSKHYRANLDYLRKDFAAMGYTRVVLWEYPAYNPSGVVAIGRCVPAFIARHAIKKAIAYTEGVKSLVNQGFLYQHWIGIGINFFSKCAQQEVTPKQVNSLLDDTLTTKEFQALYIKYTNQDIVVSRFGIQLPNPKLMKEKGLEEN